MKQYKVTIGTISKGFREEVYLLKDEVDKLIDKQIKKCKDYIKLNKKLLKLTEMTNKEWIKGRIDECEYTIDMLKELKSKLNGEKE